MITEKKHQFTQARNHILQIMFILVYAMNLKWLAGVDYSQRKKSEKLKFTKSGIFGQYPAPVFCLGCEKNSPDRQYFWFIALTVYYPSA